MDPNEITLTCNTKEGELVLIQDGEVTRGPDDWSGCVYNQEDGQLVTVVDGFVTQVDMPIGRRPERDPTVNDDEILPLLGLFDENLTGGVPELFEKKDTKLDPRRQDDDEGEILTLPELKFDE